MSTSQGGGLYCPDSLARLSYYSTGGIPNLVWNGTLQWSGAAESDANGLSYRSTIMSLLAEPSVFKLTLHSASLNAPTGSIDLDIEAMEDGIDISDMYLRIVILEDDVLYSGTHYDDVTRDIVDDIPITVNGLGQVQNVSQSFDVDSSWDKDNLRIIALLQDDTDKKLHAAVSSLSLPAPEYALRFYALGASQRVGPSSGFQYFDVFRIYNLGTSSDTYTVDLIGDVPAGWVTGICDEGTCFGETHSIALAPGAYEELKILVTPSSPGTAALTVEMSQANLAHDFPRVLKYNYITDDLDVLVVDDDGAPTYENLIGQALTDSGYTYGIWDHSTRGPDADTMSTFDAVVWSTGLQYPTLDEADREALSDYLDQRGALFITGQDIGWEMDTLGGDAEEWYEGYLRAIFRHDNTGIHTLDGVPDDPVSGGIDLVIQGGDGANNQLYPDDIDPADESAVVIWTYDEFKNGAIRVNTGTYKLVYLAFGFEAINNPGDRRDVMQQSVDWLLAPDVPAGWVPTDTPLLLAEVPGGRFYRLSWGESCLTGDVDYEIYSGTLGDFASHTPVSCSTGGATEKNVAKGFEDKYYLVVPTSTTSEGSYGTSSEGVERPRSAAACRFQMIGDCSR